MLGSRMVLFGSVSALILRIPRVRTHDPLGKNQRRKQDAKGFRVYYTPDPGQEIESRSP